MWIHCSSPLATHCLLRDSKPRLTDSTEEEVAALEVLRRGSWCFGGRGFLLSAFTPWVYRFALDDDCALFPIRFVSVFGGLS